MSLLVDIEKKMGSFSLRVSFRSEGGVMGLLGASGCGKSITLKCIAGILRPDRGRIVLNGVTLFDSEKHIDLPPQKRKVGLLFQNDTLFPHMTVRKNILCGLYHEKDKKKREKKLKDVSSLLQLTDLMERRPSQLSGGQMQRVALARILVGEPELLMLDEPFSALDTYLRERLQMELRPLLASFGKDVLFVTHSREEAFRLCSGISVMERGAILITKETRALFQNPERVQAAVVTGCQNIVPVKRRNTHLVEIPSWGITLETAGPVKENHTFIGIRSHSFSPSEQKNRCPIRMVDQMEEPFEWAVAFRFPAQAAQSPDVWWRFPKSGGVTRKTDELGVSPKEILLLEE